MGAKNCSFAGFVLCAHGLATNASCSWRRRYGWRLEVKLDGANTYWHRRREAMGGEAVGEGSRGRGAGGAEAEVRRWRGHGLGGGEEGACG